MKKTCIVLFVIILPATICAGMTAITINDGYKTFYGERLFTYYGLAGQNYSIAVKPNYKDDIRIDLYNRDGDRITFRDDNFEGEKEVIEHNCYYDGFFTIKVSNFHGADDFKYEIKVDRDKFCLEHTYYGYSAPNSVVYTDRGDSAITDDDGYFVIRGCSYNTLHEESRGEKNPPDEGEGGCFISSTR